MADIVLPYYTSDDLIEAVQRKIAMPLSQNTFTPQDILKFASEEMAISQVPSILLYHENYFVFVVKTPLVNGQQNYPIPDRSIGMKARDIGYEDLQGNLYELSRIEDTDKAFFQRNVGATNQINKYYIQGNEVVLLPDNIAQPGFVNFYIFLRPNQLVTNDQAATMTAQSTVPNQISLNWLSNSSFIQISPTNTFTIPAHGLYNGNKVTLNTTGVLPGGLSAVNYYIISATTNTFQLSATVGGSAINITDVGVGVGTITRQKTLTNTIPSGQVDFVADRFTLPNHDYVNGDQVIWISNSQINYSYGNANPNGAVQINNYLGNVPSYQSNLVFNVGSFPGLDGQIAFNPNIASTLPTPLLQNQIYYIVGVAGDGNSNNSFQVSTSLGGTPVDIKFVGDGGVITSALSTMTFDQIPSTIVEGNLIDFLQTAAGHKTYGFDIVVPVGGISGSTITMVAQNIPQEYSVGDYVCAANQCIIPQIPSDLHSGLAERTCARILASIGDSQGLQNVQSNLQAIQNAQGELIDNRIEGGPRKVFNKFSLLRLGKLSRNRRI